MDTLKMLYETYRQDVFRYLAGLTRDPALAEDLLSETFCAALISLPGFRGDSDVKTWLFTIARRKWLDHLRRKAPEADMDLAELYIADSAPGPERRALLKAAAARVRELLELENERTKKIVLLRIDGYSFYEIARQLGIREGSARVIDFRARSKIRQQLIREGYDEIL